MLSPYGNQPLYAQPRRYQPPGIGNPYAQMSTRGGSGPASGYGEYDPLPTSTAPSQGTAAAGATPSPSPYDQWRQQYYKNFDMQKQPGMPGAMDRGPTQHPTFSTPGQAVPVQLQGQMWQQGWRVGSDGLWHPPAQAPMQSPYTTR